MHTVATLTQHFKVKNCICILYRFWKYISNVRNKYVLVITYNFKKSCYTSRKLIVQTNVSGFTQSVADATFSILVSVLCVVVIAINIDPII